jgi:hypothetical protein
LISRLRKSFRTELAALPQSVQKRARDAYERFKTDPQHPSLDFKPLHTTLPLWSVRITQNYRAVGVRDGETIIWFFIGTHADYDKLLAKL